MTVEIKRDGKAVATSRNLRGLLDYARKSPVHSVGIAYKPEGADVFVRFADGATCRTEFADYSVAVHWFKVRRSWGLHVTAEGPSYTRYEA